MVFSSLLFVFLFLSLNLLCYYFTPKKYQNQVLLGFSLVFYSWGGPRYLLLLLGDTAVSWFTALQIQKLDPSEKQKRKMWMIVECVCLLGVLGIFKYTVFLLRNVQALTGFPSTLPNIILPIGISFYTFQLLSYVVDVYRGSVAAQPKFWKLLLYSSLFHQCIAGPIVRYETVANEIDHRKVTSGDVYVGIRRFCIGLAKKSILANSCAVAADTLLPGGVTAVVSQSTAGLWLGMIFYTLQLYLDFSAYSDMAIGMGRMVGFHYLENFNYPFIANSVTNFWTRWHISLSSFFKDYVYIPLGGSRCSTLKYLRNVAIVWFLTGLWHGANWNYILWGLFTLAFILLEKFVIKGRIPKGLDHVYTIVWFILSLVFFKHENMAEIRAIFLGMFGIGNSGFLNLETKTVFLNNLFLLIFAAAASTPVFKNFRKKLYNSGKNNAKIFLAFNISEMITPALLLFLSLLALIGDSYNPFLYFQF